MHKRIKNFAIFAIMAFAATAALAVPSYSTTLKTARMTAVVTAIDAGGAGGKLEVGTTGMASVLCTITLNYNPAATVSGGVLTLSGFPKTCTASATGTAAAARVRTSANVDVITGLTVGTSSADLIVDNTSINSGQTLTVSSYSFTHAAAYYERILASTWSLQGWLVHHGLAV